MKRARTLLLLLLLLFAPAPALSRDEEKPREGERPAKPRRDKSDKGDKKKKADDAPESALESAPAREALTKVERAIEAREWADAVALSRELIERYEQEILLVPESPGASGPGRKAGSVLHLPAGALLRRALADLPEDARAAYARLLGEEAGSRLDRLRLPGHEGPLVQLADLAFPLEEGGEALLRAGDLLFERGSVVAALLAWRDVLELHASEPHRLRAGQRLVAALPALGDASYASELAGALDRARFFGHEGLASEARRVGEELPELEVPDFSVTSAGEVAPLFSAASPAALGGEVTLPRIPEELDWRRGVSFNNPFGQPYPNLPRLLAGAVATNDWLLVHLGRAIVLCDPDTGRQVARAAKRRYLPSYLSGLLGAPVVNRYGLLVHGRFAYATLESFRQEPGSQVERGSLARLELPDAPDADEPEPAPAAIEPERLFCWDTADADPPIDETPRRAKKNKREDEARDEAREAQVLSYVGTPVWGGDLIYCGAHVAGSPETTLAVALDRASGKVVWRRELATSSAFRTKTQGWEAPLPYATPTPTLAFAQGALLVLTNNGALCALDPRDGRPLWARTYKREEPEGGQRNPFSRTPKELQDARGHGFSPLVPVADAVIALPQDAVKILALRVADGALLAEHSRKGGDEDGNESWYYDHLLGASRGHLVVSGERGVRAFRLSVEEGTLRFAPAWTKSLGPSKRTLGHTREVGQGVLAGRFAYVPTDGGVLAFGVSKGKTTEVVTWDKKSHGREQGDLVLGGDRWFTVGVRHAWGLEPAPDEGDGSKESRGR